MQRSKLFLFLGIILTAVCFQSALAHTLEEKFKKQIEFSPGGFISLENTNGRIEVEGWDKDMVMIEAGKQVKASSRRKAEHYMDQVKIEINRVGDELIITTRLPKSHGGGLLDWIFGDHVSTSVQYKLFVPRKSDLKLETTNGAVYLTDVSGRIRLETTNGKIRAGQISGRVNAETTNGSVKVEFDEVDPESDMEFHTTNGSIKVYLPADVRCTVRAKTTNGSIETDFPLEVRGKYNSKRLRGDINGGGPRLDLRTTNGCIKIYEK
ncbi:MAG TPA: hypothetical protein ENK14_01145 [Caldithrix sp.]|nr:hypothetical protein [Caldithrix sp.]